MEAASLLEHRFSAASAASELREQVRQKVGMPALLLHWPQQPGLTAQEGARSSRSKLGRHEWQPQQMSSPVLIRSPCNPGVLPSQNIVCSSSPQLSSGHPPSVPQ